MRSVLINRQYDDCFAFALRESRWKDFAGVLDFPI